MALSIKNGDLFEKPQPFAIFAFGGHNMNSSNKNQ